MNRKLVKAIVRKISSINKNRIFDLNNRSDNLFFVLVEDNSNELLRDKKKRECLN